MTVLPAAGHAVTDADLELAHEPLPGAEVVAGSPTTAIAVLDDAGDREIGIWEMTPGTARDTEADELFVVLSGRATIAFEDPSLPDLVVGPGSGRAPGRGHAHDLDRDRDPAQGLHRLSSR